jgi:phosphate transport system permease protein
MPVSEFSLKATDKARLWKDRIAKHAVTVGGMSVLGALILIFVYLLWVVIPLFFPASLSVTAAPMVFEQIAPTMMQVDNLGKHAFVLSQDGKMSFVTLSRYEQSTKEFKPSFAVTDTIADPHSPWFILRGEHEQAIAAKAHFSYAQQENGDENFTPSLDTVPLSNEFKRLLDRQWQLSSLVMHDNTIIVAGLSDSHLVFLSQFAGGEVESQTFSTITQADQILVADNGRYVYVRQGNELIVIEKQQHWLIREVVSLNQNDAASIADVKLLAGGYSLLVADSHGRVSQWFDVLKEGQRSLTAIRDFNTGSPIGYLMENPFSKGFFVFAADGEVSSYYTTSEKRLFREALQQEPPSVAVLSPNEKYLAFYQDGHITYGEVDLGYPEISFRTLWRKVWYESYPEPDFVWQSTSGEGSFEAKFSLVPIAFGTIKAAFYAMIFAVPIAVLSAIYTAYFMSYRMRRIVKPTIELMEALPTVIIGFLAGLWFAPLVETHLFAVFSMIVLLPLSALLMGVGAYFLPQEWNRKLGRGWHAVILIPVLAAVMYAMMSWSFNIEALLFDGDIRVFLTDHGVNFDQRNALVVGLAMGFAVIPTIFTIAEDAVFSVPGHLSDGSMALGATRWQTLTRVVLLTASPGIFSAIMMGLGRAVGETMIVLMATGNTPIMDFNILEGMRTLAATIAVELPESEVGSSHYRLLFLAALVLFIFTFFLNSLAEWIRLRLREKYRSL